MAEGNAFICGMGAVTPVGLNARQTAASVRAGISRSQESDIYDKHFEPFVLSLLPDEALPPLVKDIEEKVGLTSRQMRLLRLAAPAMQQAVMDIKDTNTVPLLLGAPEAYADRKAAITETFLQDLFLQANLTLDQSGSEVLPLGRAAGLVAMEKAMDMLEGGKPYVLVGGIDTYFDLYLLGTLDAENRILGPRVMDGFIPGEGAVFVLLGKNEAYGEGEPVAVLSAAQGFEEGHLNSEETYKGDGLSDAFEATFQKMPEPPKIQTVMAGLNGENYGAKEWGVASMRHADCFESEIRLEHPADCIGDSGAALGPLLAILAAIGLQRGYLGGPCLAWASSDYGTRAAAIIDKV
jgi:3-oxoacyl-[acyl-carrier-protein] synthase I